jgi:hypothetical protein
MVCSETALLYFYLSIYSYYIHVSFFYISLTPILYIGTGWGEWSESRSGRALASGTGPPVPIVQKAGWAPEPVWTLRIIPAILKFHFEIWLHVQVSDTLSNGQ